jgi:hypothetical protein
MNMIETIHGLIDEALLRKVETRREDDNEIATAQEWYLADELVKRDAQVQLKKWPQGMAEAGLIGETAPTSDITVNMTDF